MRLAILGGGGFRVPLVHRALLAESRRGDAVISEVVLFDTDEDRLRGISAVLERQRDAHTAEHGEPRLAVRTAGSLPEALAGAGMVFSAIRVGAMPGRAADERVALSAGVIGQETVGAGGISYGLRTVPVARRVARAVAEHAPGAWVVNFTNPAGLVTEAMSAQLGDRVIGICDSPAGLARRAARALGLDPAAVRADYAGLNHLGWLRGLWSGGRDRLPDLLADTAALESFEEGGLFGADWLRSLGALPNEYLHYYYMAREAAAAAAESARRGPTRGEELVEQHRGFYREAAARPGEAFELWDRARLARERGYMADNRRAAGGVERAEQDLDGGGYEEVALSVMRALARDEPTRLIVDVRNRGALNGLDRDAVVEVPCLVDGGGAQPLASAPLSGHQLALVLAVKSVERDIMEAVRTGSRATALRAFATHPLVDSVGTARTLLDGYLDAFGDLGEILPNP
ncbi:family 4 glycosyl hydrolase [Streptomonospora wellingtoniae]|uniref:6-phospho-beta-glucosidase n=1 Tax=Streptomonospora wellingtoniae TaxID=3075544 RepID=A0ABU2KMU9_9ACTN|nr:6-phospho-beta-glucosidase [Streptomonospora sp. DSM 45055]MDT0300590.1 6-phospho-beta-glucosidase [Streptomonospora sp. DSM 45055]